MNTPALDIQGLSKSYGKVKALENVSFQVNPGEIFGLLGPNGAGKTSLISIVVTLEKPTEGKVNVFGHDVVTHARLTKPVVGCVPQEIVNHGYFSVEEILTFHSGFYGRLRNKERIDYLLDRLRLYDHRKKKVKQLSGGMRRRLMIAKALVHNPKLLLLDEPTAGVDLELRHALWEFVRELNRDGLSILLTTHYLQEAEELCERIAVIHEGKLAKIGETKSLIRDLTSRTIRLALKSAEATQSVNHPLFIERQGNELLFSLPIGLAVGDFLHQTGIETKTITDIQVNEGTLEEAFMQLLGGAR